MIKTYHVTGKVQITYVVVSVDDMSVDGIVYADSEDEAREIALERAKEEYWYADAALLSDEALVVVEEPTESHTEEDLI